MDTHIEPFFEALTSRDAGADGLFYYAVKTTGVYCLPSCKARAPLKRNLEYFASAEAARAAGYRACKRCRPDEPPRAEREAAMVAAACRRIEAAEAVPDLAALAAAAGCGVSRFHRVFKEGTGVTPRAYAAALRQQRVRAMLPAASSVTAAMYDAGYQSPGPFYADAAAQLGMRPARYRRGGAGESITYAVAPCALGQVLVAASGGGICAISLGDDAAALTAALRARFARAEVREAGEDFAGLVADVVSLVDLPAQTKNLPLDIRGTAFQRRVWEALRAVPAGRTVTYRELAAAIGAPRSVRAVAGACAANGLAVAVPCHRAVRADGEPAGYRWGVERKRRLLDAERDAS